MTKVVKFPIEFNFTLPVFGQVIKSGHPIKYAHIEYSGIARLDGDDIEYIITGKEEYGCKESLEGFYDEMQGKPYEQTALHLATMNYLRYHLKGDMANVLDYTHFSL